MLNQTLERIPNWHGFACVIPAQAGIQRDGLRVARLDSGASRNDGYFVQSKKKYALARAVSEGGTPPELAGRWGVVGAENGADGW